MSAPASLDDVRAALTDRLAESQAAWLDEVRGRVASEPGAIATLFPAVGRGLGRGPLESSLPGLHGWTVDDAGRALLLASLPRTPQDVAEEARALYRYGDAAERRGVLRALGVLDPGASAVDVCEDALRTNDTRLVAAALGPYARYLDDAAWRHGVLKCVFLGIPLAAVAGLDARADAELARMLADYARERVAAGRDVPEDVWRVADRFPEVVAASGIDDELASPVPERREAARRALQHRTTPTREH
ncbi:MAG: EboA domain-containing protein [Actinomycetes bacterium]